MQYRISIASGVPKTSLFDVRVTGRISEQLEIEISWPKLDSKSKSHFLQLTLTFEAAIRNLHELERRARPFVESSVSTKQSST